MKSGLPVSIETERLILGTILLDSDRFESVRGVVEAGDFSLESHRRMYTRIASLSERGENIDRITVYNELRKFGEAESCGGLSYIASLDDGLPRIPNIDAYVRILKEKSTLRQAIFACQHMINRCMMAQDGAEDILTAAEATIQKLAAAGAHGRSEWRNPGEVMAEYPGGVSAFLEPQRNAAGIPTPWASVTSATGGLRKGELWIIAGRPSMGKSVAGMQIATQGAQYLEANHPEECAAVFSLEMSKESLVYRMLAAEGRIDAQRFRGGYLTHEERKKLNIAVGAIQDLPLHIDDSGARTIPAMVSRLRKLAANKRPRIIVVDFLTEMDIGAAESVRVGYSQIVKAMKHIARDFDATMILLAQLNRKCEDENRRPQLSDLKETGSVEEAADVVGFIHRWERYQKFRGRPEYQGMAEWILAKQRNGPTGICKLVFLAGQQRLEMAAGAEEMQQGESE